MREFYPEIEPYKTHRLQVSKIHNIYVEECGNPNGYPILFLHGGPGAGLSTKHRRYFDPQHYRIILFDQRGSGKSTPHAELRENSTWHLVADIEVIRKTLGVSKWHVFGGSWGSTLALAYAETHPKFVSGLILRGIFLCTKEELDWFYQKGVDFIFPDYYEDYVKLVPKSQRKNLMKAYYKLLTHKNEKTRLAAAKAWSVWEGALVHLVPDAATIDDFEDDHMALSLARIECHYFQNRSFFKPQQLLKNAKRLKNIPGVIVHGRYDVVCPYKNAWDLHKAWPQSKLMTIPDAGHAGDEKGTLDALIQATDDFRNIK